MKTEPMQKRLEDLFGAGKIETGKIYTLPPSDCSGNGFDIAIKSRPDESGDYGVGGHLMRITCSIKAGSRSWRKGIPTAYTLECDPCTPYALGPGENAEIIHRTGTNIGNGFMARVLASVAIRKADGKLLYQPKGNGYSPYWIEDTHTYASHYKSGLSKADLASYHSDVAKLDAMAGQINATAR